MASLFVLGGRTADLLANRWTDLVLRHAAVTGSSHFSAMKDDFVTMLPESLPKDARKAAHRTVIWSTSIAEPR